MDRDAPNLHQRLAAVMGEVSYIQKESKKGMQYTIVSHDAVTAKVRPALLKHGVIYHPHAMQHEQVGNRTQVALVVRFTNIDDPSDFIDVPSLGYGIDGQDKGPGKAISYGVKYALLKALGLETGDDAEHDSIDHDADPQAKIVDMEAERRKAQSDLEVNAPNAAAFRDGLLDLLQKRGPSAVEAIRAANANGLAQLEKAAPPMFAEVQTAFKDALDDMGDPARTQQGG